MPMRVAQSHIFNLQMESIYRHSGKIVELSQQAASGKRVLKPSDDPLAAQRIVDLKSELEQIEPAKQTISYVQGWLSTTETALEDIEMTLRSAKELAMSQATETSSELTRQITAEEAKTLYDQIIQLSNTKYGNRYIFGGTQTQLSPVTTDPADPYNNPIYQGNRQNIDVMTNGDNTMTMNLTAGEVLQDSGILSTLSDLIGALESNDTQGIQGTLEQMDSQLDSLLGQIGTVGTRINDIQFDDNYLSDHEVTLTETLSQFEDADVTKVYMELVNEQTAYQAALKTTIQITSMNLIKLL